MPPNTPSRLALGGAEEPQAGSVCRFGKRDQGRLRVEKPQYHTLLGGRCGGQRWPTCLVKTSLCTGVSSLSHLKYSHLGGML